MMTLLFPHPHWVPNAPGALCLFSGSKRWAHRLLARGCPWVLCYEVALDPLRQDLSLSAVRREVEELLEAGAFLQVGAGPVCASFSTAVRPPCRSRCFPRGRPNLTPSMQRKVSDGNSSSRWVASLVRTCLRVGCHVWVENPHSSWLWKQKEWMRLADRCQLMQFVTDHCARGRPGENARGF